MDDKTQDQQTLADKKAMLPHSIPPFLQKRDGFPGQDLIVLPRSIVSSWLSSDPLFDLLPSDVGYFPKAQGHYLERATGSAQLILIYCVAGEGWAQVGETTTSIGPGQVLIIPPDTAHVYRTDPDNPWSIYWVHIAGAKTEALIRLLELDTTKPTIFPGLDPALPPLFERIIHALLSGYSSDNLALAATNLHLVLTHLISARHFHEGKKSLHSHKIRNVIEFMTTALDGNLTLEELASHATMSTSHFAALFKKHTGFPPLEYFMRLKMQKACTLLDTTKLPIKEIAAQLGYDDPLYFSRRFRHVHNCSPRQYQAIQKG